MDFKEFVKKLNETKVEEEGKDIGRQLAKLAHSQLSADFPILDDIGAPVATAGQIPGPTRAVMELANLIARQDPEFPITHKLSTNVSSISAAASSTPPSPHSRALASLCSAVLHIAASWVVSSIGRSDSDRPAAPTTTETSEQRQAPPATVGDSGKQPSEEEYLPFDSSEGELFDARTAPIGKCEVITGESEEEEISQVIECTASFEATSADDSPISTKSIDSALRAIEAIRTTQSAILHERVLPPLTFFIRDRICGKAGSEDSQRLLVLLLRALGIREGETAGGRAEFPLAIGVLASACRSHLPTVSGFLGSVTSRLPGEKATAIAIGDSEAIGIAEFIKEYCSAGGVTSLRGSGMIARAARAAELGCTVLGGKCGGASRALAEATVSACSKCRPAFEEVTALIDTEFGGTTHAFDVSGIGGESLAWKMMVSCSRGLDSTGVARKLDEESGKANLMDLEVALGHLSQMATTWNPFKLPPEISCALSAILERLPIPMKEDGGTTSRDAEEEEEEESEEGSKRKKRIERCVKIRRLLTAILHPAKSD